ncbi:MAG TPA: hypothetical protein VFA09_24455 [Ktedonobacteraceae bacterium]|jgi:hypothetical protein|nr:hypothetical protein [Ktedonobacteraceae bacterium]
MQAILVLFAVFISLGLISRDYDKKTRLLVLLVTISMIAYVTLKK